ncbi:energy-coupling factor transport system ATP-binding protein [Cohnella sp. OV330]|uniref:ATP-binding cassette domain-containing protein n=1 Tax=Cohnella sp. OV330 TaxID=1855288 RepID=UPI0008E56441|nr:ATP-binding cassette domain-containing protein [Cohnella sp. OV330]SFB43508.1 energy-coupling factor transport system ATP-binding protein [Cohnella sp. OV330]
MTVTIDSRTRHSSDGSPLVIKAMSAYREDAAGDAAGNAPALLDRVDLTLAPGEWLYVVGTNGSGKSTLGKIVAGLGFPGELRAERWERGFAGDDPAPYVMQQPDAQLFGTTPREEIVFALEWLAIPGSSIMRLANEVLEEAGLTEAADLPWSALSGGQRQLAAVAAAAAGHAPLLVLDEATSMLDGDSQSFVRELARKRQREGASIVWITQRIEELERESERRVVALAAGRLVYDGKVNEFLYGEARGNAAPSVPPCLLAGLRLPFRAELAREIAQQRRTVGYSRSAGLYGFERENVSNVHQPDDTAARSVMSYLPLAMRLEGLPLRGDTNGALLRAANSLTLASGRIFVLLGPNGSGKTRLLEIAAGLREAEDVRAEFEPRHIQSPAGGYSNARRHRLLAYSYASQSPEDQLFARSVDEELDYALRPYKLDEAARGERKDDALQGVGWGTSWLERDPYAMSGGERRRTALACALAAPAPWLLLDEPTSGLDAQGCERLARSLEKERREGRGILLVSHDPDWALPLADELLLLGADGEIRHCTRRALLERPEWWEEADLRVPESYKASREAWRHGFGEDRLWKAADIAAFRKKRRGDGDDVANAADERLGGLASSGGRLGADGGEPAMKRRRPAVELERNRLSAFDPRAIWLGYVALSLSMFAATGWTGLAASAIVAAAIVWLARLPLREYKGPLVAFALFTVASTALSGLTGSSGAHGDWWHAADGLATFRSFAKTWLVLAIGISLPSAIPPLRLRRALTQILPRKGGAARRSQRLVLTVTLILRFVPQLLAEWDRFARIAVARGKDTGRSPAAMFRKLRSTAVPFMLALFRMGETVTLALESRGVGRRDMPSEAERLRLQARDGLLLAMIAIACAGLALQGKL